MTTEYESAISLAQRVLDRPSADPDDDLSMLARQFLRAVERNAQPIPMVLQCPRCGVQHIDRPEPERGWTNPPHRSHLCASCEYVWRPADVATTGVAAIGTRGSQDSPICPRDYAEWDRGRDALAIVAAIEELRSEEGVTVEIHYPNPDGEPVHAIDVSNVYEINRYVAETGEPSRERFIGATLLEALQAAVEAKRKAGA